MKSQMTLEGVFKVLRLKGGTPDPYHQLVKFTKLDQEVVHNEELDGKWKEDAQRFFGETLIVPHETGQGAVCMAKLYPHDSPNRQRQFVIMVQHAPNYITGSWSGVVTEPEPWSVDADGKPAKIQRVTGIYTDCDGYSADFVFERVRDEEWTDALRSQS